MGTDGWRDEAACRNRSDLSWFPQKPVGRVGSGAQADYKRNVAAALDICRTCPVMGECAKERRGAGGIWGGVFYGDPCKQSRPVPPCGTTGAARRHYRLGEPLCLPCRVAHNERVAVLKAAARDQQVARVVSIVGRTG